MKEQLINFETAKLAKEKGFNIPIAHHYKITRSCQSPKLKCPYELKEKGLNKQEQHHIVDWNHAFADDELWYSAPTQALLQMWLWNEYNTWIEIFVDDDQTFGYLTTYFNDEERHENPIKRGFKSPEECLEKSLYEALKLIDYRDNENKDSE